MGDDAFEFGILIGMEVIRGLKHFPKGNQKISLTIGKFDGVHLGHQALLSETVVCAEKRASKPVVLSFSPHPAVVLHPKADHRQLMDKEDLVDCLEAKGVSALILEPFNLEVASLSPRDFLRQLHERLPLHCVVVGENFRFGSRADGDGVTLQQWSQQVGVEVVQVPSLIRDGRCVSSSTIKEFLRQGKFDLARDFLGRSYYIRGEVLRGEGRGRTLKVPTANFLPTVNPPLEPGVFAGWARVEGKCHASVLSIGRKPTFQPADFPLTYECHLLDFDQDLYGKMLEFEPVAFLRGEEKFSSVEALLAQIHEDIASARRQLT